MRLRLVDDVDDDVDSRSTTLSETADIAVPGRTAEPPVTAHDTPMMLLPLQLVVVVGDEVL